MSDPLPLSVIAAAAIVAISLRWRPTRARTFARAAPGTERTPWWETQRRISSRRAQPSARAVGSWCDDLARHIRSGASLHEALTTAIPADAPTARATDAIRLRLDRGVAVTDAVEPDADVGSHLRLALDIVGISARLGGPAAAAIDRTGSVLRQRAADQDERGVQAAQARISAHVLTAVPVVMFLLLLVLDDNVRAAVTRPIGLACILVGLALNGVGWAWMRHIVGAAP